ALFLSALALAAGCGSQTPDPVGGGGGTVGVGGTPAAGGAGAGGAGTGGLATGGATTTGGAPATGGATGGTVSTGGVAGSGGAAQGGGSGGETACSFECVDQCVTSGGTPQPGACSDGMECCEISAPADPFAHLRDSAEEVGLLLANRFRNQNLAF